MECTTAEPNPKVELSPGPSALKPYWGPQGLSPNRLPSTGKWVPCQPGSLTSGLFIIALSLSSQVNEFSLPLWETQIVHF